MPRPKQRADVRLTLVHFDVEFLRGKGEHTPEDDAQPSHYDRWVDYSVHFKRLPYLMSPAKPMKAIDMSPAVMSVIGSPRRQRGIPALVSIRSRIPAMRTIASRKPADAPNALMIDSISVYSVSYTHLTLPTILLV